MAVCERCQAVEAKKGERYCAQCRKRVLQELKDAGYLGYVSYGHIGASRGTEKRQNEREMFGDENPWQSNAIRSLEDDHGPEEQT